MDNFSWKWQSRTKSEEFWKFFPKKIVKLKEDIHSKNVNKLSRFFSLFVTFSDFLLNSCPKLSNKLEKRIVFKFVLYSNSIKTKIDAILKICFCLWRKIQPVTHNSAVNFDGSKKYVPPCNFEVWHLMEFQFVLFVSDMPVLVYKLAKRHGSAKVCTWWNQEKLSAAQPSCRSQPLSWRVTWPRGTPQKQSQKRESRLLSLGKHFIDRSFKGTFLTEFVALYYNNSVKVLPDPKHGKNAKIAKLAKLFCDLKCTLVTLRVYRGRFKQDSKLLKSATFSQFCLFGFGRNCSRGQKCPLGIGFPKKNEIHVLNWSWWSNVANFRLWTKFLQQNLIL